MKISRMIANQKIEIELTPEELRNAFYEQQRNFRIEDIISYFENRDLTDDQICEIANNFNHNIGNCDSYYEAYWDCLEYSADPVLNE